MFSLSCDVGTFGGFSSLVDISKKKSRTVFLFPSVIVPLKERNKAVIDFTSQLFGVKGPNRINKTVSILKRALAMTEKLSDFQPEPVQSSPVAKSTPGPILPQLASEESYSAQDSLRIVYFLGRFVEAKKINIISDFPQAYLIKSVDF